MFNLGTKQLHQTFTGHANSIRILKTFEHDDSQFILSGSQSDRHVSIWKITEDATEALTNKSAFGHFALNGSPSFLSWQLEDDDLQMACVATDDSLLYFTVNLKRYVLNCNLNAYKTNFLKILARNPTKSQSSPNIKRKLHLIT